MADSEELAAAHRAMRGGTRTRKGLMESPLGSFDTRHRPDSPRTPVSKRLDLGSREMETVTEAQLAAGKPPPPQPQQQPPAQPASSVVDPTGMTKPPAVQQQPSPPDSPEENSRPCGACYSHSCPYCTCTRCKDGQCKLCFAAYRTATESALRQQQYIPAPSGSSSDPHMAILQRLESSMSELKVSTATKDDLKMALQTMKNEILDETNTATKTAVTVAVEPLKDEVVDLKKRLSTLETKQVSAASVQTGASTKGKDDPAFKKLAFKGIPEHLSAEERLRSITAWMENHFKNVRVKDVVNIYTGPFPNGRKLTGVTLVELSSSDVRRGVLEQIEKNKNEYVCKLGNTSIDIRQALTQSASERNTFIRNVVTLLKKDARCKDKNVEPVLKGDRGVTVDGIYVFEQKKGKELGTFLSPFLDMKVE